MFKFLKEKLKSWIGKSKEEIEKKAEKIEEPVKEEKISKKEKTKKKEEKRKAKKKEEAEEKKEEKLIEEQPKLKEEEQGTAIKIEQEIEEGVSEEDEKEIEEKEIKEIESKIDGVEQEIEKISEEKVLEVPLKFEVAKQKYEPDLEKLQEEVTKKIEASKNLGSLGAEFKVKEEKAESKGFFGKLKSKFSYKISEEDFNNLFENLEALLLENNVALEVVEDIKKKLSQKLIGNEIKKEDLESKIKGELKSALNEILIEPDDPLDAVRNKKNSEYKPFVILFFGINGTGKCLAGETKIQLSNGEIEEIKNIYENYNKKLQGQTLKDGEIIELNEDLLIPSFNPKTLKIEDKKITHLWKLKKEELYEVRLDNGNDYSIKVTPEHPFFVLRNGKIEKIRADKLLESDYIATPKEITINGRLQFLFQDIKKFNLDVYLTPEEIKEYISFKNKILIETHKKLKSKRNYCSLSANIKRGKIPIEFLNKGYPSILKIKEKMSKKVITFPTSLTMELSEFLGYLMGDGNITPNYIQISNEDTEIINRIKELSKLIFNLDPIIKKAKRTKNMYDTRICSKTLVNLMSLFGLKPGKKGKQLQVPKQIMLSDEETIRMFIKAYFDCDGSPARKARSIELISESEILITQMDMLLKRLGIVTTISKKIINNIFYWRLSINSKYAERYAEKIGSIIKNKRERLEEYSIIGLRQGCGKQDMISLGKSLKKLRLLLGFAIADIQKYVPGYQIYEKKGIISKDRLKLLVEYYKIKNRGSFFELLGSLNKREIGKFPPYFINGMLAQLKKENFIQDKEYGKNRIQLTENGKQYLQLINESSEGSNSMIKEFEYIANSDVCWIPLESSKKIKNDGRYVYDLTVEDNHSFIAEGFIVHNTTSIAKLAYLLQKNNFSVVLAAADTFRAASIEQIQIHADKLKIPLIKHDYGADPSAVGFDAIKYAEKRKIDVVLIDTAGRMHTKTNLLTEMKKICRVTNPDLKVFVAESIAGNDAVEQAKTFHEMVEIDGSILSKADIDEKGGTIISVSHATHKPIFYLGTGQNYEDLKLFNKQEFIESLGL